MKRTIFPLALALVLLATLLVVCGLAAADDAPRSQSDFRIGVLAYQDFDSDRAYYNALIKELERTSPTPIRIRVAIGTYAELSHWIKNDYIDLALVSPGIVADVLSAKTNSVFESWKYFASELRSIPTKYRIQVGNGAIGYSAVCLVPKDSAINSIEDIRLAAASGRAHFFGVDSISASGFIAPMFALNSAGVAVSKLRIRFTHSHSNALRFLTAKGPAARFGCVWKGALADPTLASHFRVVPIPALDSIVIPPNALLGKKADKRVEWVVAMLLKLRPDDFRIEANSELYSNVTRWRSELAAALPFASTEKVLLSDISATLLQYTRTHLTPARLAVVFAGGGAKCSYQVGAIRALEEELARVRQQFNSPSIDIGLVVGTSGGAINALPVALGITRTEQGQRDFVAAWQDLDQREIIHPSFLVRLNIGLWLCSIELFILLAIGKLLRLRSHRSGLPIVLTIALGVLQVLLSVYPTKPWQYIGLNSALHHTWLWITWGLRGAGLTLISVGIVAQCSNFLSRYINFDLIPSRSRAALILLFAFVALPVLQGWTMLWRRETLSESSGIEHAFKRNFEQLINQEAKRRAKPELNYDQTAPLSDQFKSIGVQLKNSDLLDRDLVITASPLKDGTKVIPGDLYFFASASNQSMQPEFGSRGVSLDRRPELMFDALIGSGAIYPIFPPRKISDFPQVGQTLEVVDGSFAHRSPLEAAVLWGATHIILIEASTDELIARGGLLSNISAALTYLYDEAQLTDVRAREEVSVFTLIPEAPHIGLLDFSDNLINLGIQNGYREASGALIEGGEPVATFRKQVGKPSFD